MTNSPLIRFGIMAYLILFFSYLLGPLILMSITAFNSSSFPQVAPWEVFTFEWFSELFADEQIIEGLRNSFIIGFFTVILSVAMGMAGALVLTQIWPKLRSTYYTIIIAPILIPGVVLGISTLVFWQRVNSLFGLPDTSFLQDGIFLTVLGQSTFISSYCMLVFVARLQRYDTGLTEAALDLGATHVQAFKKIQLPFMMPAVGSASVLAFLASFENYNTTTFTFMDYPTLTIILSQKVRLGINPSVSALAFLIICLTVFFALVHEVRSRRAQLAEANGAPVGAVGGGFRAPKIFAGNPAAVVLALFVAAAVGTLLFAQVYDPTPAKKAFMEKKRIEQQKRIEAVKERMRLKKLRKSFKGPDIFAPKKEKSAFGNAFDPKNLNNSRPGTKPLKPGSKPVAPFGGAFNTKNLGDIGPDGKKAKPKSSTKPKSPFGGVFDPSNLGKVGGKTN